MITQVGTESQPNTYQEAKHQMQGRTRILSHVDQIHGMSQTAPIQLKFNLFTLKITILSNA